MSSGNSDIRRDSLFSSPSCCWTLGLGPQILVRYWLITALLLPRISTMPVELYPLFPNVVYSMTWSFPVRPSSMPF